MIKLTKQNGDLLANKKNGKCLDVGKTSRHKWKWECSCGNVWYSSYAQIRDGSWCPNCSHKKVSIDRLREFANKRNGHLVSLECDNILSKVCWRCSKGHEWDAIPSNVIYQNKWCPTCAKNKKLTIDVAQKIAKDRKAKLLSEEYINIGSKLRWICEGGHEFLMSLHDVKNCGHWCPYCKSWNSEEICRFVFEKIFDRKFVKIRPKWLKNDIGNYLELDGYSDVPYNGKYIAFEHNGLQHYQDSYLPSDFKKILYHDQLKLDLCTKNNVVLFTIPHLFKLLKLKDLSKEIKRQADIYGLKVHVDEIDILDLSSVYLLKNKLRKYSDIVLSKGGKLLSNVYLNSIEKLNIDCGNGHIFKMSANSISNGHWCPYCKHTAKLSIEEMQLLAKSHNGQCISNIYINARTKLVWKCSKGHEWLAAPYSIKGGSWCPVCSRIKSINGV